MSTRVLPIREQPLPGEAFDSWLYAYAQRLDANVGELTTAIGLPGPHGARWIWHQPADRLSVIAQATGIPVGTIGDLFLEPVATRAGLTLNRADPGPFRLLHGSRWCPACLADTGGRWQIDWRLPWTFACTEHHLLLAERCDTCGERPRTRPLTALARPQPTCCDHRAEKTPLCCGRDLTVTRTRRATREALAAQHTVNAAIAEPAATTTLAGTTVSGSVFLGDLAVACRGLVRDIPDEKRDIVVVANTVTAALAIMAQPDIDHAATVLRQHLPSEPAGRSGAVNIALPPAWRTASATLQKIVLRAQDERLRPADRLRYATTTAAPRIPDTDTSKLVTVRLTKLPQQLWPRWTLRLLPATGHHPDTYPIVLATCLVLPGTHLELTTAARLLGATTGPYIAHVLAALDTTGAAHAVVDVLATIAERLDNTEVPIDYQRRRQLLTQAPHLSESHWMAMCRKTGARPGKRKLLHARRYLLELLTGNSPHAAPAPLRLTQGTDTKNYHHFRERTPAELIQLLHTHAHEVLAAHSIDEPLTWEPPLDWITRPVTWPGVDPDVIDHEHLARLVARTPDLSIRDIAKQLGTTAAHVRHALQHHRHHHTTKGPPRYRNQPHPRCGLLDPEHVRHRYEDGGWSWQQIADEAGISKHTAMNIGSQAGITSRPGTQARRHHIDPDWLRHAYLTELRTFPDIAAELGLSPQTIRDRARSLSIPIRPRGGASHQATLEQARPRPRSTRPTPPPTDKQNSNWP